MGVVGVLHRKVLARSALRRGMGRRAPRMVQCASAEQLMSLVGREVVDAVIVDIRKLSPADTAMLFSRFPSIPVFALGAFRPDDGPALTDWRRAGLHGIVVEGVDGTGAGEWLASRTASHRRQAALTDAPRLLRLTERLQREAFDEVVSRVGRPVTTSDIARALDVTREHLSREFAAGGAPNLKRVIDAVRICCAADLLTNPGYDVLTVSRILRFASASHFARASRRVAGVTPVELRRVAPRQVLQRFVRGRTRSRV